MSKIFLVKKDPAKEGQDNWIPMPEREIMILGSQYGTSSSLLADGTVQS